MASDNETDATAKGKMSSEAREEDAMAADEQSPLLPRPSASQRPGHRRASSSIPHIHTIHDPRTILYTLVFFIFVIGTGFYMVAIPTKRIIEDILCHKYYDAISGQGHIGMWDNIDEELCKEDAIQEQLAYITGISEMLQAVPSIFCAIPYGILADRIGRRIVLFLATIGVLFSFLSSCVILFWWHIFPIYLIFLSPVLCIFGGGNAVLIAMIYAIVSDVSTEEARAVNFLYVSVGSLSGQLLGPTMAGILMKLSSPWVANLLGIAIVFLGSFVIFVLPETLHIRKQNNHIIPTSNTEGQNSTFFSKTTSRIHRMMIQFKETISVLKSVSIVLLVLSFFTHLFNGAAESFSAIYISKRFHWKLSETSYLLTITAFINILLLVLIIPLISHILSSPTSPLPARYRLPTPQKDLLLARISIVGTAIGAFLISGPTIHFAIFGLIIFSLRYGFTNLVRSVITTMVDQQHVGRLYSWITIVDTLGAVVAGPCLPWLFQVGLKEREEKGSDAWMGLPYLGTAGICGLVAVGVSCARLPDRSSGREVGNEGTSEGHVDREV